MIASLGSYAYWVRGRSIFACKADGYSADRYLSGCNAWNYGEYEHGAFWYDLEPAALDFARKADVVFLGNSRLQLAFSTKATADWFSTAATRYYLLGFSIGRDYDNDDFEWRLLDRLQSQAKVYVVDLSDFFDRAARPARPTLDDEKMRTRYEGKRFWQLVHERVCGAFSALCGSKFVIFRSRETGAYEAEWAPRIFRQVSYDENVGQDEIAARVSDAMDFLKHLPQGKCVILTIVPHVGTKVGDASAIAAGLGKKLVTPGVVEGLQTDDGYHLNRSSAERWSKAFFEAAGPEIRSCLEQEKETAAHS